jgi:sugar lactone lactonase YvrE
MTSRSSLAALAIITLVTACDAGTGPAAGDLETKPAPVALPLTPEVFADGLEFPRGFAWAPNGDMYVAEAGTGGTTTTTAEPCAQVVPPVGPYSNGPTSRISRIDRNGHVSVFATGFPSDLNQLGLVSGVADIAFVGNQMFALMSGGGCDHGSLDVPQGIARVEASGEWTMINDLGAFEIAHPTAVIQPGDFEPSGTWYSMIRSGGSLVAVEPNHGDLVRVDPRTGGIARIADLSAHEGHWVPTVIAERRGAYYISNLGVFPVVAGAEKVIRVSRSGEVSDVATGFTTVLGLDFDRSGRLYVLENSSVSGDGPTPLTGRVIRLDRQGHRDVIVDGLFLPTAMRFGPDGRLYISSIGFGPPLPGQVLRVTVPGAQADDPALDLEG